MKTIDEAIYETIHRDEKPPKVLADEIGCSYSYLMRMGMQTESGVDFNLKYLVPLMKATGNFLILKVICQRCAYLLVKRPRGTKKGAKKDLTTYQKGFSEMMAKLFSFAEEPTENKYNELNDRMREHMSDTESIRRKAKQNLMNQVELF